MCDRVTRNTFRTYSRCILCGLTHTYKDKFQYMLLKKSRGSLRPQTSNIIQAAAEPREKEQARKKEIERERESAPHNACKLVIISRS